MTPQEFCQFLSGPRFSLVSEKKTQAEIAEFFDLFAIPYSREHRLSPKDIPDFFVTGIVIEVKANSASASNTARQLARYAAHECVTAIILMTNRAMVLPSEIEGKPVFQLLTGRAWL